MIKFDKALEKNSFQRILQTVDDASFLSSTNWTNRKKAEY